jgi:hypothetical protein
MNHPNKFYTIIKYCPIRITHSWVKTFSLFLGEEAPENTSLQSSNNKTKSSRLAFTNSSYKTQTHA